MAYVALMVFVCALFLLVTAFRTSHNDLMVVGISWVDPTGTLQAVNFPRFFFVAKKVSGVGRFSGG